MIFGITETTGADTYVQTVLAIGINIANQPRYMKAVEKNNGKPVPEARLPPLFVGSALFVSLAVFNPSYHHMTIHDRLLTRLLTRL
jgi:hypothetical protein